MIRAEVDIFITGSKQRISYYRKKVGVLVISNHKQVFLL